MTMGKCFSPQKSVNQRGGFSLILLVLSGLVLLISAVGFYHEQRKEIENQLKQQADRIETAFGRSVSYSEEVMTYMARQILTHDPKDYVFISNLLASYHLPSDKILKLSSLGWANSQHRYIVSGAYGVHADEYLDLSKRDYITRAVEEPFTIQLGKPSYGVFSKQYVIPMGYGVVDKNGKYIGTVVIGFMADDIKNKLEESINVEGIKFSLLEQDSAPLTSSNFLTSHVLKALLSEHGSKITKVPEGILYSASWLGKTKAYGSVYYRHMKDYPYVILIVYDANSERIKLNGAILHNLLIFSIFLFLFFLLLSYLRNNLMDPLFSLLYEFKQFKKSHDRNSPEEVLGFLEEIDQLEISASQEETLKQEDIEKIINYSVELLKASATSAGVFITSHIATSFSAVHCFPNALKKTLLGLLLYCVKYSQRGSEIVISAATAVEPNKLITITIQSSSLQMNNEFISGLIQKYNNANLEICYNQGNDGKFTISLR